MAARMLAATPVSASACPHSSLTRRAIPLPLPLHSCSLLPAPGGKSLLGEPLLRSGGASRWVPQVRRRRAPTAAAVLSMLPTSKPEGAASADKVPKWSLRAIKSFCMGQLEARKLKYPNTGTETLLMGILVEGTSLASRFLRANGITHSKVQEETLKLLGKADMFFYSPERPPLTEPAQRALDWALEEKLKSGDEGEITATHLLLGIWSEKESAGHRVLASLGFDDEKASELAKTANKDFEFNYR